MTQVADIVIVNWNSGPMLRECIESIINHRDGVGRIVVVDNGSSDSSANLPSRLASACDIVFANRNLGFAKACNLGASRCASPFVLFLNPDARLTEPSVARVIAFMEAPEGARYGICGIKLLGRHGDVERHCANFTDTSTYLGHVLGVSGRFPRLFTPHFMRDFDHLHSRPVDQVIGAFFFVRRSLFDALRGFDERYFVYFEEVDFALRARKAGWDTYYLADATAYHYGGGTSEKVKAKRLFYSLRSRLQYAHQHFSTMGFVTTVIVTLVLEPISRLAQAGGRGSMDDVSNVLRAYLLLARNLLPGQPPQGR